MKEFCLCQEQSSMSVVCKFLSLYYYSVFFVCVANSSNSSMKVELLGKENSVQNIIKPS